jgi:hypothetical protein
MIVNITGDTGGLEPYDIFLCDPTNTGCFYVSGLTNIPATVVINTENYFPNENFLYLRIVDTNGCVYSTVIDCAGQKAYQDDIYFNFMDGFGYIFQ